MRDLFHSTYTYSTYTSSVLSSKAHVHGARTRWFAPTTNVHVVFRTKNWQGGGIIDSVSAIRPAFSTQQLRSLLVWCQTRPPRAYPWTLYHDSRPFITDREWEELSLAENYRIFSLEIWSHRYPEDVVCSFNRECLQTRWRDAYVNRSSRYVVPPPAPAWGIIRRCTCMRQPWSYPPSTTSLDADLKWTPQHPPSKK